MSNWEVPLSDLAYGDEEAEAVLRVLRSEWLSMGEEVQAFEKEFAAFTGVRHALAVSNGTAALHLSLLALGIGNGDEVIQPAINFVAAANMTVAVGATPVFADIVNLEEPTIDPDAVERLLTPRTKAVIAMHYGGYPCRMAELSVLCEQHGVALIEDACHAVGARYLDEQERPPHGGMAGALADVGCFSFFSNKNLATGEGGMVVTNRDDLAEQLRLLRSHGMTSLSWDRHHGHARTYDVVQHGYNYRTDEVRAALGRVQLKKLPLNNQARSERVAAYRRLLGDLPAWTLPFANYPGDSAHHLMVALAPDLDTRSRVIDALREARIQTSMHYPYIPEFAAFAPHAAPSLEHSERFVQRAVTLPLFPTLSLEHVDKVCSVICSEEVASARL